MKRFCYFRKTRTASEIDPPKIRISRQRRIILGLDLPCGTSEPRFFLFLEDLVLEESLGASSLGADSDDKPGTSGTEVGPSGTGGGEAGRPGVDGRGGGVAGEDGKPAAGGCAAPKAGTGAVPGAG